MWAEGVLPPNQTTPSNNKKHQQPSTQTCLLLPTDTPTKPECKEDGEQGCRKQKKAYARLAAPPSSKEEGRDSMFSTLFFFGGNKFVSKWGMRTDLLPRWGAFGEEIVEN
uniref:Uncharacterized protein n=1 Tax=Ditylenchus dipsaci TaxID=166011 RepID=A0A915CVV2_9BILA